MTKFRSCNNCIHSEIVDVTGCPSCINNGEFIPKEGPAEQRNTKGLANVLPSSQQPDACKGCEVEGSTFKCRNCDVTPYKKAVSIYQEAIDIWGQEHQLRKAQEELLELALAISRYIEGRPHNVMEEMADVEIVMKQLILMFSSKALGNWRDVKLKKFNNHLITARGR